MIQLKIFALRALGARPLTPRCAPPLGRLISPFKIYPAQHGGIAVEFALILPILIIFALPVVDFSRYILLQQKTVKAASFMADAIAMSSPIESTTTQADVDKNGLILKPEVLRDVANSLNILMQPFAPEPTPADVQYQAVITHVFRDPSGAPVLGWQYDQNSQNFYAGRQSIVGVVGGAGDIGQPATVPASIANNLDAGENLIVAEVSAQYTPVTPFLGALGVPFLQAQRLSYVAYFRARYGNLKCIWGVYGPPPNCDPI